MKQVELYTQLDLSEGGQLHKNLHDGVEAEAKNLTIVLSGARQTYNARQPGLLTQNMAAWYSRYIASQRVAAIAEVKNAFETDAKLDGGSEGVYLENRRDLALQKTVNAAIAQAAAFADKNREVIEQREQTLTAYNLLNKRLGREPVRTKVWLYVLCLLGIVLLEAFINFESFLKVPYITSPFLATGATMAVGLAVAFAAHFHGMVFRQWHFLFSPQEAAETGGEARRNDAIRRLTIGSILLFVALSMVSGSRYYYLRDYIVQSSILGIAPPSMFGGITFMVLGNIVAYVVGLLVAYAMHDPHPIYAELDKKQKLLSTRVEELKKSRSQAQNILQQGANAEIKAFSNQDQASRGINYNELRQQADFINNKDQEVIGVLIGYRNALISAMGSRVERPIFRYTDGAHSLLLPLDGDQFLTGDQYSSIQISLGFNIGDN